MAKSTGIILAVGGITFANELLFAPIASGGTVKTNLNWRLIPATLIGAAALAALEQVSQQLAVGVAYIALVTVLFARLGNAPAPVENVAKALGYKAD